MIRVLRIEPKLKSQILIFFMKANAILECYREGEMLEYNFYKYDSISKKMSIASGGKRQASKVLPKNVNEILIKMFFLFCDRNSGLMLTCVMQETPAGSASTMEMGLL